MVLMSQTVNLEEVFCLMLVPEQNKKNVLSGWIHTKAERQAVKLQ